MLATLAIEQLEAQTSMGAMEWLFQISLVFCRVVILTVWVGTSRRDPTFGIVGRQVNQTKNMRQHSHLRASRLLPCPLGPDRPQTNISVPRPQQRFIKERHSPQSRTTIGAIEGMLSTRNSCSSTRSCPIRSYRTRASGRKYDRWMRSDARRVWGESARSI